MDMHTHDDAPAAFDQPFWDNLYSERPNIWSGHANQVLTTEASKLTPGSALDIGSGEGADAFWLADNGWKTTGADISPIALERARQAQGDRTVKWLHRDLTEWAPPATSFDLVSAHFFHLPPAQFQPAVLRFGDAVTSGGHLLIVGHSPSDALAAQHGHAEILFTADEVTALFPTEAWSVVVAENRARTGTTPEGEQVERVDAVAVLRKL
ncbi:SAM-dependent methyltransferase [Rhodococcus sp. UYP5]